MPATASILLRLTPAEHAEIAARAARAEMSLSRWIASRCLSDAPELAPAPSLTVGAIREALEGALRLLPAPGAVVEEPVVTEVVEVAPPAPVVELVPVVDAAPRDWQAVYGPRYKNNGGAFDLASGPEVLPPTPVPPGSTDQTAQIFAMLDAAWLPKDVAEKLGCSLSVVYGVRKKWLAAQAVEVVEAVVEAPVVVVEPEAPPVVVEAVVGAAQAPVVEPEPTPKEVYSRRMAATWPTALATPVPTSATKSEPVTPAVEHELPARWMRTVVSVDTSKGDGYAFAGVFLKECVETLLRPGEVVVALVPTRRSRGKRDTPPHALWVGIVYGAEIAWSPTTLDWDSSRPSAVRAVDAIVRRRAPVAPAPTPAIPRDPIPGASELIDDLLTSPVPRARSHAETNGDLQRGAAARYDAYGTEWYDA